MVFFAVGGCFKSNLSSLGICEEVSEEVVAPHSFEFGRGPKTIFWRGDMATSLQLESSRKGSLDGFLPKNVREYSPEN